MSTDNMAPATVKPPYWDIAADVYFPPGFDESKKYPAVISAHPIGSCKEQTSGNVDGTALADTDRIGVLGICGGGGYSITAAKTDRRIKVVGSVVGVNFGHLLHEVFSAYDPIATLDAIAAQRTAEVRGAEPNVENLLPPPVDAAEGLDIDVAEAGSYRDGLEIYRRARSGKSNPWWPKASRITTSTTSPSPSRSPSTR